MFKTFLSNLHRGYRTARLIQAEELEKEGFVTASQVLKAGQVLAAGEDLTVAAVVGGKLTVAKAGGKDAEVLHPWRDPAPQGSRVTAVAGTGRHMLAVLDDGRVVAWGDNSYGLTQVPHGLRAVVIAAGDVMSLAINDDEGKLISWGQIPVPGSEDLPRLVTVAAGRLRAAGLTPQGEVVVWGWRVSPRYQPPAGLRAVALSVGDDHMLAIDVEGDVVAWGKNAHGQCSVPPALKAVAVAAGSDHSIAITPSGEVIAWGANDAGQCRVPAGLRAVAVTGGDGYSVAMTPDGEVVAWGRVEWPNGRAIPKA